jgi:uncharacterized protein (TIGR02466 family)
MPDTAAFREGFVELWPTLFLQLRLDGAAEHNRRLVAMIREMERRHRELTTDYLEQDLLERDEPSLNWLRQSINGAAIAYFRRIGVDYDVNWTLQAWPNVNRFGDYHDYHNHPRAYLSGTYYVKVPTETEALRLRREVRPGCISFYDPRYAVNMGAIRGDPYVNPEYTIRPEPGMLLMWPGFINHFVHPNLSKEIRVSISFNLNLKWSDRYLPSQR